MDPLSMILATALLSAPPDTPEPTPTADEWQATQAALHAVAIRWEILDPREARYVLARPEDFQNDLNLLRRRYKELSDAPLLADNQRFPDRGAVNEMLAFNRAYRRHLDGRQPMETDRATPLQAALRETDKLYQVWDSVRDARCDFYYVTVRRQALKKLRDLLGPDDYYAGKLPPYVPLWRFQEIH